MIDAVLQSSLQNMYIYNFGFQIKAMAEGRDRRPELGYKLAMELKNPDSVLSQRNGYRAGE